MINSRRITIKISLLLLGQYFFSGFNLLLGSQSINLQKSEENSKSMLILDSLFEAVAPLKDPEKPKSLDDQKEQEAAITEEEHGAKYYKVVRKKKEYYIDIMKDIAHELGLTFQGFSGNYLIILRDEKRDKSRQILQKRFEINSSTSCRICDDKAFTYDLLRHYNVPAVPHKIFVSPTKKQWVSDEGTLNVLIDFCEKEYGGNVVIKPKSGASGRRVFHCQTTREIEAAALDIYKNNYGLVVSPFYKITSEFRLVMLGELLPAKARELPQPNGCFFFDVSSPLHESNYCPSHVLRRLHVQYRQERVTLLLTTPFQGS